MTKKIINCETGDEIEVELSAEDIAQQEIDEANYAAREAEKTAKEAQKAAVLAKLGLSAEELASLFA